MIEDVSWLAEGFAGLLSLSTLAAAAVGAVLGTLVGLLPGLGPSMAIALLLPLARTFEPTTALVMFAAIYIGAMYGGSTTAILLNVPGEAAAVATALEGNRMARSGRAHAALATAAWGSLVAGMLGLLAFVVGAAPVARWAFTLTSADYVAIAVLAFTVVSATLAQDWARGLCTLGLGLALGMVGPTPGSGAPRLTAGISALELGVETVVVAVGLLALADVLLAAWHGVHSPSPEAGLGQQGLPGAAGGAPAVPSDRAARRLRRWWGLSRQDTRRSIGPWLRGTAVGLPMGILPTGGADTTTFLVYGIEQRRAQRRGNREFGAEGAIEGVAGPEAANNAAATGTLVPLLAIGMPTSATGVIMLKALQDFHLSPGPELFAQHSVLVGTLIASLVLANLLLVVLNLPLATLWATVTRISRPYLLTTILFFALLSAYLTVGNGDGLLVLAGLGVLGAVLRHYDWPLTPLLLGVVLGPLAETNLQRALQVSLGDPAILVSTPFSLCLYALALTVVLAPWTARACRALRPHRARDTEVKPDP